MSIKDKRSSHMSEEKKKKLTMVAALALGTALVFGTAMGIEQNQVKMQEVESEYNEVYDIIAKVIQEESSKETNAEETLAIASTLLEREEGDYKVVQDANAEYHVTEELKQVLFETTDEKTKSLYMYLESTAENQKVYRSLTEPEISLIATTDIYNKVTYQLHRGNYASEAKNKEFSDSKVMNVITILGPKTYSYARAMKMEADLDETNNYKEIDRLEYQENGNVSIRMVEYFKTENNRMYYKSVTAPEVIVSELKNEQGYFNGYEIVVDGKKIDAKIVSMAALIGGPKELTPEFAEAMEKDYAENYDKYHQPTVEDYNRFTYSNVYEMTWKMNDKIVTKLMYFTTNGKENFYNSITDSDGIIIETLDENGNTIAYYSAQTVFMKERSKLDVIHIKKYAGKDMTFEEAVDYEAELNERNQKNELENNMTSTEESIAEDASNQTVESLNYIKIGSAVDLEANAKIYTTSNDMANETNAKNSYYGSNTQIGRTVEGVVLSKDGAVVIAHNDDEILDYSLAGYELEGYSIDNNYSFDKDGNYIASEGWVTADDAVVVDYNSTRNR